MAEGNRALVERLFAQHGSALRAFFFRRVRRPPDAAELAQDVYLRMLRVPDLSAIKDLQAYLFTVANNLARDHVVQERRDRSELDVDDPALQDQFAVPPSIDGDVDHGRRIARLREVLDQLPAKCQAAVILHYWHGQSHEEIALRFARS